MAADQPAFDPQAIGVGEAALAACSRIAPIWPLSDFVAVNPMQGLSGSPFAEANAALDAALGQGLLMPRSYYLTAFEDQVVTPADVEEALAELAPAGWMTAASVIDALRTERSVSEAVPTVADAVGNFMGRDWSGYVVDQIGFWGGAYYDRGQALWPNPWKNERPYAAWRAQASLDRAPEVAGITGFRAIVRGLPADPVDLLRDAVSRLSVPTEVRELYFHRLLATVGGWAGHERYRGWQGELGGGKPEGVIDILAIRMAYDLAIRESLADDETIDNWRAALLAGFHAQGDADGDGLADRVAHRALELAYEKRLVEQLADHALHTDRAERPRPAAQAVFCIDVRSERFRRNLEALDGDISTYGFAGFFGLPIAVQPVGSDEVRAQCPVLLTPQYTVHETCTGDDEDRRVRAKRSSLAAWKRFKNAAISSFAFVEALGVGFLTALVKDTAGQPNPERRPGRAIDIVRSGLGIEDRVALASNMLAGMSLGPDLGRLVLLAGHGATVTNNPYASGLDCGACGGHAGDSNARLAAGILNDPEVRASLARSGTRIPDDTIFLAGLHDTVTDDVTIFADQPVPASHADDLSRLRAALGSAGRATRIERSRELQLAAGQAEEALKGRAQDWSQVRPEWGLAGCASFIAAPRERSRGVDLGGRAFLHSYEWKADPESAVLELIMTAPLVVASWINLQYYASTVNNQAYGSGDKTLHNVVGGIGILEGNGGDLRGGLPLQSIHDGERFYHTPIRLSAVIEAPVERIDAILEKHSHVAELFDNGWLTLIAVEDEGRHYRRYRAPGRWDDIKPQAAGALQQNAA